MSRGTVARVAALLLVGAGLASLVALAGGGLALETGLVIRYYDTLHRGPGLSGGPGFLVVLNTNGPGVAWWSNGTVWRFWAPLCGYTPELVGGVVPVPVIGGGVLVGLEYEYYYDRYVLLVNGTWTLALVGEDGVRRSGLTVPLELEIRVRGGLGGRAYLEPGDGCPVMVYGLGGGVAVVTREMGGEAATVYYVGLNGSLLGSWSVGAPPESVYLLDPGEGVLLVLDSPPYLLRGGEREPLDGLEGVGPGASVRVALPGVALVGRYVVYSNGSTASLPLPGGVEWIGASGGYVLGQTSSRYYLVDALHARVALESTTPVLTCPEASALRVSMRSGEYLVYTTPPPIMEAYATLPLELPGLLMDTLFRPLPVGAYRPGLEAAPYCLNGAPLAYANLAVQGLDMRLPNIVLPLNMSAPGRAPSVSYATLTATLAREVPVEWDVSMIEALDGAVALQNPWTGLLVVVSLEGETLWTAETGATPFALHHSTLYLLDRPEKRIVLVNLTSQSTTAEASLDLLDAPSYSLEAALLRGGGLVEVLARLEGELYPMLIRGDRLEIVPRPALGLTFNPEWGGAIVRAPNGSLITVDPFNGSLRTLSANPAPVGAGWTWMAGSTIAPLGTTRYYTASMVPIVHVDPGNRSWAQILVPAPRAGGYFLRPVLAFNETGIAGFTADASTVFLSYYDPAKRTIWTLTLTPGMEVVDVSHYGSTLTVLARDGDGLRLLVYEVSRR